MKKKIHLALLAVCIVLLTIGFAMLLTACGSKPVQESVLQNIPSAEAEVNLPLQMLIGDTAVAVDWEENESVEALKKLCLQQSLTISMSMYGGFEQVGPIGTELPRNDVQTTTEPGDIVLYSGNQVVVFYGSNSWAYTRLGHISDQSEEDLAALLGNGDVTITFRAGENRPRWNDVIPGEYYFDAVIWAVNHDPQITNGTSPVTFSPAAECTRGQAAAFLWRAHGSEPVTGEKNPFTDVSASDYYYDAVLWAYKNGITEGTTKTTFSPDAKCTRGQIVTFLWRSEGKPEANAPASFTDVGSSAYYYEPVQWALENKVTNGTSESTFSPDAKCTRGQIVTFLYRALAEK